MDNSDRHRRIFKGIAVSVGILGTAFLLSLVLQKFFDNESLIPLIFVLAVFLISFFTSEYVYGIAASLASVLMVNYAFAFPEFQFNFTLPENLLSAVVMLVVTVCTTALTTRLKMQEKIKAEIETEKMRADLLRAVSHDLRTPLTTIYGGCSGIKDNYDKLTKEQKIKLLTEMGEEAQSLIRMVENLLSVTKVGGEKVSLVKTETVLEELIDSALIRFKKHYPSQEVEIEIPDELVTLPADAILIEQAIVNLLDNAVEHAEGMKKLKLAAYTFPGKVVFEVSDDGCGVDEERIKKLFSGYGGEKTRAKDGKNNMGIGLSVCAAIVKAHGGEISAQNNRGGGMTFRFWLSRGEDVGRTENE